jgi:hypothetical protein
VLLSRIWSGILNRYATSLLCDLFDGWPLDHRWADVEVLLPARQALSSGVERVDVVDVSSLASWISKLSVDCGGFGYFVNLPMARSADSFIRLKLTERGKQTVCDRELDKCICAECRAGPAQLAASCDYALLCIQSKHRGPRINTPGGNGSDIHLNTEFNKIAALAHSTPVVLLVLTEAERPPRTEKLEPTLASRVVVFSGENMKKLYGPIVSEHRQNLMRLAHGPRVLGKSPPSPMPSLSSNTAAAAAAAGDDSTRAGPSGALGSKCVV